MRKLAMTAIGAMAMIGFATPALAHNDEWNSRHDWQHDRLGQRHDNVHDQLEEEHDEAHDQGLGRWEHRQLHRELQYQHAEADYRIAREHQRQHRRNDWRRRYYNYGY